MSLKRIEYYSQANPELSLQEVTQLSSESAARNERAQISGWLNYDGACFFHCLEGESTILDPLFKKILADPRHREIVTLSNKFIPQRHFEGWSMHISAGSSAEQTMDAVMREELARPDGNGVEDMISHLSLWDLVILGGHRNARASAHLEQSVEAAGRRWQSLAYKTFVRQMAAKNFTTMTEVAAAMVELVLLANRRGPAALPALKLFLMRRTDLVFYEIDKACKNLLVSKVSRDDALNSVNATDLVAALTAVTFAVRALGELRPNSLKTAQVKRALVNLCRAALDDQEVSASPLAGLRLINAA